MQYANQARPWLLALAFVMLLAGGAAHGFAAATDAGPGPDGCDGCEVGGDASPSGPGDTSPPEIGDTAPPGAGDAAPPGTGDMTPAEPAQEPSSAPAPAATRTSRHQAAPATAIGDGDPCELRSGPDSCARPRSCSIVVERERVRIGGRMVTRIVRGKKWVCTGGGR